MFSFRSRFVLVSFPFTDLFTDLTSTKRRPALVISPDAFNQSRADLIVTAITSQVSPTLHVIQVAPTDCLGGSLPKESLIKITKVFTLSSALVLKRLCRLNDAKLQEVLASIRELYS